MSPEEINKKAYEKYPVKMDVEYDSWGNAEDVDLNARRRQGYIEAYKEISALPTIKGWVARDKYGLLHLFCEHPRKGDTQWNPMSAEFMAINRGLFLDHFWPDNPIKVELPIIRK